MNPTDHPRPHRPAPGGAGRRERPAPSVYRRRRRVAAALATLAVLGLGSVSTGLIGGSAAVVASDSALGPEPFTVIARSGDTMWELAHRYRGEVDHDRFLEVMIALNGSASVRVGQAVLIPG